MEAPIIRTFSLIAGTAAALLALAPGAAANDGDPRAFVEGRLAALEGDSGRAALAYARALDAAPDDVMVAARAYRQALAAGDYPLAVRSAAVLEAAGAAPADAALVAFTDALARGNAAQVDAALARLDSGPLDFLAPVLRAWVRVERGGDVLAPLAAAAENPLGRRYAEAHRPLLLIASGETRKGMKALTTQLMLDQDRVDLRVDAALLLAGQGERRLARQLLAGDTPEVTRLRSQIGRGVKPSAAFGAARLLVTLAEDMGQDETLPLAILLARSALQLDGSDDRARLFLAEALSGTGDADAALAVLGQVRADGLFAAGARARVVTVLQRAGRNAEALDRARALAEARGAGAGDAQRYGDALTLVGDHAAAADAYAQAIARAGDAAGWLLHLQHGSALERAGDWAAAEPVLRQAVALAPEQPVALNQLAYGQVERGEDLDAAQAMLEQAHRLDPGSNAIADSLAWAYYRRGDYAAALPLLEGAARAEPADPEIHEHLGDLYWRLGRRFEARYAWAAAAVAADAAAAARLAAKQRDGLPAAD